MKILFTIFTLLSMCYLNPEHILAKPSTTGHTTTVSDCENPNKKSLETVRTVLYKGTLNESTVIWLYLKEQESACGGGETMIDAMYKYDSQGKWLLLGVTQGFGNNKLCMVEDHFTGVLLLEENGDNLNGNWVSPDIKKQFKIALKKVELNDTKNDELEEILYDDLLYNKNDC